MTSNEKAFLDMLAYSELGERLLAASDNGYNVIVGSTAQHPHLFTSYADHPRVLVKLNDTLSSTAAGRYQILKRTFDAYKIKLKLSDFSPASQDAIALYLIKERNAIDDINAGQIGSAIAKVYNIWASLPGAGYGQHEQMLDNLIRQFVKAGGVIT